MSAGSEGTTGSGPSGTPGDGEATTGASSGGPEIHPESTGEGDDPSTGEGSSGDPSDASGDASGDGMGSSSGGMDSTLLFYEPFDGGMNNTWPAPWVPLGGLIAYDVTGDGRGRLLGHATTVGRVGVPGFTELDVDLSLTVTFEDWAGQGMGAYVRQNGGWLVETMPPGAGYAIYIEGHGGPAMGVWREVQGVETLVSSVDLPGVVDNVPYRVRVQCEQVGGSTVVRGRLWPAANPEPATWLLEYTDNAPTLQNVAGSIALDVYNYDGSNSVYFDDVELHSLP